MPNHWMDINTADLVERQFIRVDSVGEVRYIIGCLQRYALSTGGMYSTMGSIALHLNSDSDSTVPSP